MGHVHALGLAPFGDEVAVARDKTTRGTARLHRADYCVERLVAAERGRLVQHLIPVRGRLAWA